MRVVCVMSESGYVLCLIVFVCCCFDSAMILEKGAYVIGLWGVWD